MRRLNPRPYAICRFEIGTSWNRIPLREFSSGQANGTTNLIAEAGGKVIKVPVKVQNFEKLQPVSFRHQVIAGLNVGGCNAGACHGTPSGKNGFKLTLAGYHPAQDYIQASLRDVLGRRTDRLNPMALTD